MSVIVRIRDPQSKMELRPATWIEESLFNEHSVKRIITHSFRIHPEGSPDDFDAAGDANLNWFGTEEEARDAAEMLDKGCPLDDGQKWCIVRVRHEAERVK